MIGESQDRLATLATENNELRARVESLEKADKQREKTVEYLRERLPGSKRRSRRLMGRLRRLSRLYAR
jgi:predicted RNase H-like nuclease (RuvC/YqgF family)